MRRLVEQLELELYPSALTIFGITDNPPGSSELTATVMGEEIPFLPNPTLRSSLWDDCSKEERADVYAREWSIDFSSWLARHQSGFEFHYAQNGARILVRGVATTDFAAAVVRNLPSAALLEILAEQGFACLRGFDGKRHFQEIVFDRSWFSLENSGPIISVA
jgi:hypothetical protein